MAVSVGGTAYATATSAASSLTLPALTLAQKGASVYVFVGYNDGSLTSVSVTDDRGNLYRVATHGLHIGDTVHGWWFWADGVGAAGSLVITVTTNAVATFFGGAMEIDGADPRSLESSCNTGFNPSTAWQYPVGTLADGDLILIGAANGPFQSFLAGTNVTIIGVGSIAGAGGYYGYFTPSTGAGVHIPSVSPVANGPQVSCVVRLPIAPAKYAPVATNLETAVNTGAAQVFSDPLVAGDTILVAFGVSDTTTEVTSIVDTRGNTFTRILRATDPVGGTGVELWAAYDVAGGPGTLTVNQSVVTPTLLHLLALVSPALSLDRAEPVSATAGVTDTVVSVSITPATSPSLELMFLYTAAAAGAAAFAPNPGSNVSSAITSFSTVGAASAVATNVNPGTASQAVTAEQAVNGNEVQAALLALDPVPPPVVVVDDSAVSTRVRRRYQPGIRLLHPAGVSLNP